MSFGGLLPPGIFPRDILLYWDGGPADRNSKTAFTDTDTVSYKNINRAISKTFDGVTSKIDAGTNNLGDGDATVCFWLNPIGEGTTRYIIGNGSLIVGLDETNDTIIGTSNGGSTIIFSATNGYTLGTNKFYCLTRPSGGANCNFYANGVLSGDANQDSGTPAAGVSNTTIGNDSSGSLPINAYLGHIRVFSKLLTVEQIGWLYNKEK